MIDLEWGHYGDPLEDLGNFCVREFWNPSGGLDGLFHLYEQESGIPYSRFAAQYYRVQQNVRGHDPDPRGDDPRVTRRNRSPGSSPTATSATGRRASRSPRPPGSPSNDRRCPTTSGAATFCSPPPRHTLDTDVEPKLTDPFARSRANDVRILLDVAGPPPTIRRPARSDRVRRARCAARRAPGNARRWIVDARSARSGRSAIDDAATITYLSRRAYRDEWLHAPAVTLYPDRRWSTLDE